LVSVQVGPEGPELRELVFEAALHNDDALDDHEESQNNPSEREAKTHFSV
jgi:hypothetical protein